MESPEGDRVKLNPSQNNRDRAARDTEPQFTRQEYLDCRKLLNCVKLYWVEAVLEKNLYKKVPNIQPDLEERLDLVNLPNSRVWETPAHPRQELSSDTKLINVFDRMGAGRKLPIVGEPGSAKTTALLKLARILIERIESGQDFNQPIPVVFDLSSWANKRQTFAQWIVQELRASPYEFEEEVIETWLKNKKLLLLLDGLDEVRARDRQLCIQYLYKFIEQHRQTELVICCRIQVYEDIKFHLGEYLSFHSAIELKPLSREKINGYVDRAGSDFAAVKRLLQADDTLYELVNTPLMLSVMLWAFKGKDEIKLPRTNSIEKRRQNLFDCYIARMFYRKQNCQRDLGQPYPTQKSLDLLIWLAKTMRQHKKQPIFLIEQMQPNLLQPGCQKFIYRFGVFLLSALVAALIYLIIPLLFKLQGINPIDSLLFGSSIGIARVVYEKIEPIETLECSPKKIISNVLRQKQFVNSFKILVIILTISTIATGLLYSTIIQPIKLNFVEIIYLTIIAYLLLISLLVLLAIIPFLGLGLKGSNISDRERIEPNFGIRQSITNSLIFSFIGTTAYSFVLLPISLLMSITWRISSPTNGFAAAIWLGLTVGLYPGLVGIQHLVLRLILRFSDESIPLDLGSFLKYADERIFLQKVGNGYKFIHNLLRDRFAQIESEEFITWMQANKHQMSD